MSWVGTGIGIAGAGAISSSIGGKKSAKGASRAANAQLAESRRQRAEALRMTEPSTMRAMADFDTSLKVQEKNLARQEQLLAQIDPTIMEASQQALKLLRGESSSVLAPAKQQRDMQRQKLLASLREQLGPGAETSTAGIQALTRFDAETNQLMSNQQQSALQNLGNTFGQFSSYRPDMGAEASTFANLAQGRAGLRFNQLAAMSGANQQVYSSSGAGGVRQTMLGQNQQAMGNAFMNLGGTLFGAGMKVKTPGVEE